MKALLVIALIAFAGTANAANRTTCGYRTAAADSLVFEVKARAEIGEATITDLSEAELSALEVKFDCRAILFNQFCEAAPALAKKVAEGLKVEVSVGQRTQTDYSRALDRAFQISGICQ